MPLIPCWTCQLQEFFCKYAILQDTRFSLSRHSQFSFSCRKLGQVSVPRSSLFSHRIVLYGKASEVKRQEIFFLLERGVFFAATEDQLLMLKRNSLQAEDYERSAIKSQFDVRGFLLIFSYAPDKSNTDAQSSHTHGNLSESNNYLPAHCSFSEAHRSHEDSRLDVVFNMKSQSVQMPCAMIRTDSCGYPV